MKRLAIFAHFDKKNIIDDYVLFYVNQLKKHCDKVLFYSLSDLDEKERKKLEDVILVKHNEYDFGSYKRGFYYAKEHQLLEDIDEILFVNDSCYCINSLDKIFDYGFKFDFWGIVENNFGFKKFGKFCFSTHQPHLQSWFLAFRKNVFTSEIFEEFLNSIKEEKTKNDVILNYEIALTKTLKDEGFRCESYVKKYKNSFNPSIYYWRELLKDGLPFIKCSVLKGSNRDKATIANFEEEMADEKIVEMIKKNTGEIKVNKFFSYSQKMTIFRILRTSPDVSRRIMTKFLKVFCPFIFD